MDDDAQAEPRGIHDRAARGDLAALNQITAGHYRLAATGEVHPAIGLARAVEFARLAAVRGGREEMVSFIYLLEQHAFALRDVGLDGEADVTHGQALAMAESMASDGDEEMGNMVIAGAGDFTPASMMIARDLRRLAEPVTEH